MLTKLLSTMFVFEKVMFKHDFGLKKGGKLVVEIMFDPIEGKQ